MINFAKSLIKDVRNNICEYISVILICFTFYKLYVDSCPKIKEDNVLLKYSNIKNKLDTGDLLLFSSNDYIGRVIRKFSNSYFSHCGIVVKQSDKLYILECDMDNSHDYLSNKSNKNGAHILDLDEKINDYTGNIFGYCKLNNNFNENKLKNIIHNIRDVQFNNNLIAMYNSVIKNVFLSNFFISDSKMFCSEFVVNLYQRLGVIKYNKFPNMFNPSDIALLFEKIILFRKN